MIVAGGGFAGVAAALAARRTGASVLLLEKTAAFGGLGTNGLISWYEPLCNGLGEQFLHGLPEELLRLSIRYGDDTLPKIWQDPTVPVDPALVRPEKAHPIGGRYATFFSPTLCQLAMDEALIKEGVQIRLDILCTRPLMEGSKCLGVICESKSGREFFPAKAFVDATGDADLFYRAGCECKNGENYFSFIAQGSTVSQKENALGNRQWIGVGSSLHGEGHPEGYPKMSGTTNEEVTKFLLDGRSALLNKIRNENRKTRDIASLPTQAQFRKTRRICGAYTLLDRDVKQPHKDSIGLCPDFERVGDWYEIPYGTLYSPQADNLFAAGRMISSDEWAWDVTRVIPTCALTGQAAGIAAALLSQRDVAAAELDVALVQKELERQGIRLHKD